MLELPQFLTRPPQHFGAEEWLSLSDGERLRWVKAHQLELDLSRAEYLALCRLPFWAAYGPEHGLPSELFNDRGFLLPKYRPGGGLYPQFKAWRRSYRHASWQQRALDRRLQRFDYSHGGVLLFGILGVAYLIAMTVSPLLQNRLPRIPEGVLGAVLAIVLTVVTVVAIRLALTAYSWCATRHLLAQLPPPEGLDDGAG